MYSSAVVSPAVPYVSEVGHRHHHTRSHSSERGGLGIGGGGGAGGRESQEQAGQPRRLNSSSTSLHVAVAPEPYAPSHDKEPRGRPGKPVVSMTFKVSLVVMDCLLLGLQPVLVHLSKNENGDYAFNPVSINFLTEVAKTAFALCTLVALGTGRSGAPMYRSPRAFFVDAHHNALLIVPAGLYAVNNYLKFAMQLFFRPTTTKMLGNLKIFTIAILMKAVMHRSFTVIQWEALFLLVAGITVNQLQDCGAVGTGIAAVQLVPAVLCTAGTVTVPSAASVYNEFALKRHMETSVHLQNFFLYFYGACFNLSILLFFSVCKGQTVSEIFAGQSSVTCCLIATNAAQGVLSSFFYKYADTILKKYSSTIATIFTALISFALFGHPLTVNFLLGVSIVMISMHQFFSYGHPPGKGGGLFSSSAPTHHGSGHHRGASGGPSMLLPSLMAATLLPNSPMRVAGDMEYRANGSRPSHYPSGGEQLEFDEAAKPLLPR